MIRTFFFHFEFISYILLSGRRRTYHGEEMVPRGRNWREGGGCQWARERQLPEDHIFPGQERYQSWEWGTLLCSYAIIFMRHIANMRPPPIEIFFFISFLNSLFCISNFEFLVSNCFRSEPNCRTRAQCFGSRTKLNPNYLTNTIQIELKSTINF